MEHPWPFYKIELFSHDNFSCHLMTILLNSQPIGPIREMAKLKFLLIALHHCKHDFFPLASNK